VSENVLTQTVEVLNQLPKAVRHARIRRRLSIRGSAKQIGISHVMLQRLEGGRLPNVKSLQRVLAWLDAPIPTTCPRCGQELPPDAELA
jgi:transcriptional regulator with XRE-family HTH domain